MPPPHLPRIEELEYWGSGGEKARLAKSPTTGGGHGETITISTELYERLAQGSKQPPPPAPAAPAEGSGLRKFANPTPVGLFGLFITDLSFSVIELGWGMGKSIGMLNGILGSLFFTGPVMLLFAALAEWIAGNFFGFIVSAAMGVLWLSLGVVFVPALGVVQSYSETGDYLEGFMSEGFNGALGVYLIGWGFALFVILICSMKTNVTFIVLFAVLDASFFVFAAAHFQVPTNPALALVLQKVGAGGTFIVAILLFYLLCYTMFEEMGVAIHLPLGDLSAPAAPKNPIDDYMLHVPIRPDSYDHHHSHRHHHHRHPHDEEAQWNPRISMPLQRS